VDELHRQHPLRGERPLHLGNVDIRFAPVDVLRTYIHRERLAWK
jgi:hypothetical protein